MCKRLILILLFSSTPLAHAIDPILSFFAGAAAWASASAIYSRYNDRQTRVKRLNELNIALQSYKFRYKEQHEVANLSDNDKQLAEISSLLIRAGFARDQLAQKIESDLLVLADEHIFSREIENAEERTRVQKDIAWLTNDLKTVHMLLTRMAPFIELEIAKRKEQERLHKYEVTLQSNKEFPHITTTEQMNRDAAQLIGWIHQAEQHCNQYACSELQQDLVQHARVQFGELERKSITITQSPEFERERNRYEMIVVEEKKAEAQKVALLIEHGLVETKLNEQKIKDEQLRQNDEQLRQNAERQRLGQLFEPEKRNYENTIHVCQTENKEFRKHIKEKDQAIQTMKSELAEKQNIIMVIGQQAEELEQHFKMPPFNPEAEDLDGLARYLETAKLLLKKIICQCSGRIS